MPSRRRSVTGPGHTFFLHTVRSPRRLPDEPFCRMPHTAAKCRPKCTLQVAGRTPSPFHWESREGDGPHRRGHPAVRSLRLVLQPSRWRGRERRRRDPCNMTRHLPPGWDPSCIRHDQQTNTVAAITSSFGQSELSDGEPLFRLSNCRTDMAASVRSSHAPDHQFVVLEVHESVT